MAAVCVQRACTALRERLCRDMMRSAGMGPLVYRWRNCETSSRLPLGCARDCPVAGGRCNSRPLVPKELDSTRRGPLEVELKCTWPPHLALGYTRAVDLHVQQCPPCTSAQGRSCAPSVLRKSRSPRPRLSPWRTWWLGPYAPIPPPPPALPLGRPSIRPPLLPSSRPALCRLITILTSDSS